MKPLYGKHIIKRLAAMKPPVASVPSAVADAQRAGTEAVARGA
jgi:hypothetical protein